jgi:hypothetical protein
MTLPGSYSGLYSCAFSRQVGEQLFGTAPRVDVWLCLEYNSPWGADAFAESDLADPVKQRLSEALAAIPKSRLQLIRRSRREAGPLAFYVARSDEANPVLYDFKLDAYDDLPTLDIAAVASGDPSYTDKISADPLFLVCANGKRDVCCARYGLPVYDAIFARWPRSAWQTTHVGGHRFAGNMVCLPHGICYGRLGGGDAAAVADDYRRGMIHPEAYRGRSCYDEAVQAADYFLRTEAVATGIGDFHLSGVERIDDVNWLVEFQSLADATLHRVQLVEDKQGVQTLKNSGDTEKAWVPQYRLVGYETMGMAHR